MLLAVDLCWQGFLGFVRDNPAFFTAMAFVVFWFFRFAFGHKMYRLTCRRLPVNANRWWNRIDLHDWEVFVVPKGFERHPDALVTRCSRCHGTKTTMVDGDTSYRWP